MRGPVCAATVCLSRRDVQRYFTHSFRSGRSSLREYRLRLYKRPGLSRAPISIALHSFPLVWRLRLPSRLAGSERGVEFTAEHVDEVDCWPSPWTEIREPLKVAADSRVQRKVPAAKLQSLLVYPSSRTFDCRVRAESTVADTKQRPGLVRGLSITRPSHPRPEWNITQRTEVWRHT